MTETGTHAQGMTVVYDGQCPFCESYVRLMALRKSTGTVTLVDARSGDPCVKQLQKQGYDLNEGMVAIYGDTVYYGSDALSLISAISDRDGIAQQLLSRLLANPRRARYLYPVFKRGRRIALRLLGRPDIPEA